MAVTSYDGSFSFKQDSLARLGRRDDHKMSADQYKAFQNSPFMQKVQMTEDLCWQFTNSRDQQRLKTDPSFKPQDTDFSAPKAHEYERAINYYKVLGIEEFATLEEVKKAYKKLSLVYHPDKTAGMSQEQKDEYAGIFIELKNAYLTLGDNPTRRQYDRDRDRDKASFEVNGFKTKQRAHFDATEVMKKLQEMQRPPGRTIDVPVAAKLEKFFYGGHKAIKRQRNLKTGQEFRLYRVDIPRGAPEPHECCFRRQGDQHEDRQADSLNFKITSKPHDVVERSGDDLQLKSWIELGRGARTEPYLNVQAPSVRGRHLLLWGCNPFYRAVGTDDGLLRVSMRGEGLTATGALHFSCHLSGSAGLPLRAADGHSAVVVRHMQTGAALWLKATPDTTMATVRTQISSLLDLPRTASVRLLYKYSGGVAPYPDRQTVGDLRELHCSGTAWHGVSFTAERSRQLLEEVIALGDAEDLKAKGGLWASLAPVLLKFGCEPNAVLLEEKVAAALAEVAKLPDGKHLVEQVEAVKRAALADSPSATGSGPKQSLKRFLERHELGPPEGFEAPGSDSEAEQLPAHAAELKHGEGGLCSAPAMLRRVSRRLKRSLSCDVTLAPVSDAITLFTKPTCQITFYANATSGGLPLFGLSISSPPCAKRVAAREWETLKARLVPVLQVTSFHLLRAAQEVLPRPLSDVPENAPRAAAVVDPAEVDDGLLDPAKLGSEEYVNERQAFLQRRAVLERRERSGEVPWKRLGDEAFAMGDYFTAAGRYTRLLRELGEERHLEAAVALSNRAACFAKAGHHEASLVDAQRARELRPQWGRAWSRVGAASLRLRHLEQAVEAYFRAVEFEPIPRNVEALWAAAVEARGQDPDVAHAEKEKGNEAVRVNELGLAVAHYTLGVAALPPEAPVEAEDPHAMLRAVLLCDRAAAWCRLRAWPAAAADAARAAAAKSDFARAQNRLGTAELGCAHPEAAYVAYARALKLEPNNHVALKGRQACIAMLPTWRSVAASKRLRERFGADLRRPKGSTKVYCISDLHFDHKVNEDWTHRIDDFKFREDVLIVAGNASDTKNALLRALTTLKSKFRRVFYVPGNHEMWVHPSEATKHPDSLAKLLAIFELCDELGVDVFPAAVAQDVFIVPMLSWYHAEFDVTDPFPDAGAKHDQHCKWPLDADTQVWRYMLKLNQAHFRHPYHGTVISFSHFVPLQGLPFNTHNKLAKAMGCEEIDDQLRLIKVKSRAHVYGHSSRKHAQYDNGVLYVNHYHGQEGGQDEHAPVFLLYDGKALVKKEVAIFDGPTPE